MDVIITTGEHPNNAGQGYLGISVSGFMKISIEGELPDGFEFDLQKEVDFPGGDA